MDISLIKAIEQKGCDIDGLTPWDSRQIEQQFAKTPAERAQTRQVLKIFDNLTVDAGERRQLEKIFGFKQSGKNQLNKIIGSLGNRLSDLRFAAISKAGKQTAIAPLLVALNDKDKLVREQVARVLGVIKNPKAAPALMKALGDKSLGVRWNAVNALIKLKKLNNPRVRTALVSVMKAINARSVAARRSMQRAMRIMKAHFYVAGKYYYTKPFYKALPVSALAILIKNGDATTKTRARAALHLKRTRPRP